MRLSRVLGTSFRRELYFSQNLLLFYLSWVIILLVLGEAELHNGGRLTRFESSVCIFTNKED